MQLRKVFKSAVWHLLYLFITSAPLAVYISFIKSNTKRSNLRKYDNIKTEFIKDSKKLKLSGDWFSVSIPHWLILIEQKNLHNKNVNVLEIGSWEGLSTYFILKNLPNAHLTCVDTWEGSDELKGQDVLNSIEKSFDSNLKVFRDRLIKFKGTSFGFFNTRTGKGKFDLIYVDGSHYCDDVILDAIKGYEQLKVGGIMIFDDYFWHYYTRSLDNPAAAINAFLKLKKGTYRIVRFDYQISIEKTSDRNN